MGWLIFFFCWILFLWLYHHSEKNKQLRAQSMQTEKHVDYGSVKRDFDESMKSFNDSEGFKARLAHIDRAIGHLEQMEEMLPGKDSASQLSELLSLKRGLTHSGIKGRFQESMRKARETTSTIAKVNHATSAQAILSEGLDMGIDKELLSEEIEEANDFINQLQYDEYLAKASKEEAKGNTKGAIDQYQVALYFLKMAHIGSEKQDALVNEIESKLQSLS
ncbi:MAG: hypothetical protein GXP22_04295 [Gammaproteobacteria bacterium]|nr:hypothetical protein [Gammaproteobacteria bacterium]